jgi:hypothetical protein
MPATACSTMPVSSGGSASRRQIFFSTKAVFSDNCSSENKTKMTNGSHISNLALFSSALNSFFQCQYCNADNSTECFEDSTKREGLAAKLVLVCMMRGAQYVFCTFEVTKIVHENNIQLVYVTCSISKGQASGK